MKAKELKRLSRSDLLEMMLALSKENEELRSTVNGLKKDAENRAIAVENAGSLAEAALQLSGIFQAAQAACDTYTENIRYRSAHQDEICQQMEQQTRAKCEQLEQEVQAKCEQLERETRTKCDRMEQEMRAKCDRILTQARKNAREYLLDAKKKAAAGENYSWLMDILENETPKDDAQ